MFGPRSYLLILPRVSDAANGTSFTLLALVVDVWLFAWLCRETVFTVHNTDSCVDLNLVSLEVSDLLSVT